MLHHFDTGGAGLCSFDSTADGVLYKDALLLPEGTHTDNKGNIHHFPAALVQRFAANTNAALDRGEEVPFITDHSKELFAGGQFKRLGELASRVECRAIAPSDLPDPKMTHLLGKIGAFARVAIRDQVDKVQKGLIKRLSPGIDLQHQKFGEISAVLFPAINGPSLLFAQFSLDYTEAKKQVEANDELKQKAQKCFEILWGVLTQIDRTPPEQLMGLDVKALKRNALGAFHKDLSELLGVEDVAIAPPQIPVAPPPANPYMPNLYDPNAPSLPPGQPKTGQTPGEYSSNLKSRADFGRKSRYSSNGAK